jgi:nucleotide-binding universal stress UspA family protein
METIIAATDFSPAANNAVLYAGNLAKFLNAKLIILHAFQLPVTDYYPVWFDAKAAETQAESLERLKLIKKRLTGAGNRLSDVECIAAIGTVAEVIGNAVNKSGGEMVVMGMESAPGLFKKHLIGSSVFSVIRKVRVPVMIIPEKVSYTPIRKISLACDLEKADQSTVIYNSRAFGAMLNAGLEIVNVTAEGSDPVARIRGNALMEKALKQVAHHSVTLKGNNVSKELERFFKLHPTGLVILQATEHNFMKNIFAPGVTKRLVYELRTPVLLTH